MLADDDSYTQSATDTNTLQEMQHSKPDCYICLHLGASEDAPLDVACDYVHENVGRVATATMFEQVQEVVRAMGADISIKQIECHFKIHAPIPKLVQHELLMDLHDLASVAKRESIIVQEETGARTINPKNCSIYLDTVKQIINILRVNKHSGELQSSASAHLPRNS